MNYEKLKVRLDLKNPYNTQIRTQDNKVIPVCWPLEIKLHGGEVELHLVLDKQAFEFVED